MTAPSYEAENSSQYLEKVVAKICIARLFLLGILLLFMGLAWMSDYWGNSFFQFAQQKAYALLLIIGFALNVFYLLSWRFFSRLLLFFRVQLFSDIALASCLILFTGGIRSGFIFLFLMIAFLYGRTLGFKTALYASGLMVFLLLACLVWQAHFPQLWSLGRTSLRELSYNFSLQLVAFILVSLLVRLGQGQEERLILKLLGKEQALTKAEALKANVFDWMDSGLLVLDQNGYISSLNRKALELAELKTIGQAVNCFVGDIFPGFRKIWLEYRLEPSVRMEVEQGSKLFGLTMTKVPELKGNLIFFSNITTLRGLQKKVQQMEKLASVGELAAGLAHEIKNPLAGIKASLQLLNQGGLNNEQEQRLNKVVLRDINRLDDLLKDFLAFARPQNAKRTKLTVIDTIEEILESIRLQYPQVRINIDSNIKNKYWIWDKGQLQQVLLNLILNAFQACANQSKPKIEFLWIENKEEKGILIIDNGPGLDKKNISKLFDPFFTTKDIGTGLGLSIAQRLSERNNAFISFYPDQNTGTQVKLMQQIEAAGE